MKDSAHLVLEYIWYDRIESGSKTIEYRNNIDYWRKRLQGKKVVIFHRGYTSRTMAFKITKMTIPDNHIYLIKIYLGERIE